MVNATRCCNHHAIFTYISTVYIIIIVIIIIIIIIIVIIVIIIITDSNSQWEKAYVELLPCLILYVEHYNMFNPIHNIQLFSCKFGSAGIVNPVMFEWEISRTETNGGQSKKKA